MTSLPTGRTVEFYVDARGKSPVTAFLDDLQVREREKVYRCLRLLREFGTRLRMPYAKPIALPLWELRPQPIRLLYFLHTDQRFIILHAFRKKRQRVPRREINTAERRMNRFLEREE